MTYYVMLLWHNDPTKIYPVLGEKMNNLSWQTILEVGCEGGSIALQGQERQDSWIFKIATDETSLKCIFDKEDLSGELTSESGIVSTWEEAFKLFDQYEWITMYPVNAHPEFEKEIMAAIYAKLDSPECHINRDDYYYWGRWKEILYGDSNNYQDDYYPKPYFVNSVAPPSGRLIVKRNGRSITRQIPKPVVLIDTREKDAFYFKDHHNWVSGVKFETLKAGDYTVDGMESLLILERKSLSDLISTLIHERKRFIKQCELMTNYQWRAILVEASYEDVKSPYDEYTNAHPNAVSGTLDAIEAKYGIQVIYTSRYKPLAEEKAASWLSKHFTYWYLESQGLDRVLQEGDL